MAEILGLYDSVITRRPNKKEMWMGFWVHAVRQGQGDFDVVYNMAQRQGIDISEPWAHEVSEGHMNCVSFSNDHIVIHQPDGLAISAWRNGLGNGLPSICRGDKRIPECLSSPRNGNTRCPILYGKSVVLETYGNQRLCNGGEFNEYSLVIGDGPLVESIQIADNPNEAVVSIDPKIRWGVNMVNNSERSNIQATMGDQFISLAEMDVDSRSAVIAILRNFRNNRNIFAIDSRVQILNHDTPDGFFDHVYCSFPYPSSQDSFWEELVSVSMRVLRKGGDFVLRTENRKVRDKILAAVGRQGYTGNSIQNRTQYPRTLYSSFFRDSLDLTERIIQVIK